MLLKNRGLQISVVGMDRTATSPMLLTLMLAVAAGCSTQLPTRINAPDDSVLGRLDPELARLERTCRRRLNRISANARGSDASQVALPVAGGLAGVGGSTFVAIYEGVSSPDSPPSTAAIVIPAVVAGIGAAVAFLTPFIPKPESVLEKGAWNAREKHYDKAYEIIRDPASSPAYKAHANELLSTCTTKDSADVPKNPAPKFEHAMCVVKFKMDSTDETHKKIFPVNNWEQCIEDAKRMCGTFYGCSASIYTDTTSEEEPLVRDTRPPGTKYEPPIGPRLQ